MSERAEIYREVLKMGRAIGLPGAWEFLQPSPDFVELTMPAADMAGELLKKFELRDLLPSRVLLRPRGDEPRLNPLLTEPPRTLFPVVRTGDQDLDLVGNGSRTMSGEWTLRAIRRDCRTEASIVQLGCRVIVVPELVDAAICLALGLPVVPATALHQLVGKGLVMLRQQLALESRPPSGGTIGDRLPGADSESSPQPVAWVLADWRIAELDTTEVPLIHEVRDELVQIDKLVGLGLTKIFMWKPNPEEANTIRFASERGRTTALVVQALRTSLERSSTPLRVKTWPGRKEIEKQFRESARRMVSGAQPGDPDTGGGPDWATFHNKLQQEVVEPIRAQARATSEPIRRQYLTLLAELASVAHPALARLISEYIRPDNGGPPRELPTEDIKAISAIVGQMLAVTKNLL